MTLADTAQQPAPASRPHDSPGLGQLAADHLARLDEANERFFGAEADAISRACRDMAERFRRGGRLLVAGGTGSQSDALHVSVEFLHPVLVGKRALPALVLGDGPERLFELHARTDDIAMAVSIRGDDPAVDVLRRARQRQLLTIAVIGASGDLKAKSAIDYLFRVPAEDPLVVQEVQETCYHVLYELVHVFIEHEEVL